MRKHCDEIAKSASVVPQADETVRDGVAVEESHCDETDTVAKRMEGREEGGEEDGGGDSRQPVWRLHPPTRLPSTMSDPGIAGSAGEITCPTT